MKLWTDDDTILHILVFGDSDDMFQQLQWIFLARCTSPGLLLCKLGMAKEENFGNMFRALSWLIFLYLRSSLFVALCHVSCVV